MTASGASWRQTIGRTRAGELPAGRTHIVKPESRTKELSPVNVDRYIVKMRRGRPKVVNLKEKRRKRGRKRVDKGAEKEEEEDKEAEAAKEDATVA